MATDVILPKVDMDMATGTVSKWYVADGDTVKKGQPVFDIETDKAAMEIESPADGVIRIKETRTGVALPIGEVLAVIFAAGEAQTMDAPKAAAAPAAAPAAPVASAPQDKIVAISASTSSQIRATPLARRLARQNGLTLGQITGSGPRGRIVAADVTAQAQAKPAAAALPVAPSTPAPEGLVVKPFDGMRKTIAQRLTQSKQTVPHFYLEATCTIDELLAIRERLNASLTKSGKGKLSINDFIVKAMGMALQQVPAANVSYVDGGVAQHVSSDVGVAVSVEGGLFMPVVRQVETKTLSQISAEIKDLAARAKERKLQPAEYAGGSAAVSNLGMYGVEKFAAIINPPQASILAVGAAVERFVPVNKQPVLKTQVTVTLSVDHRTVDGALGAQLLQAFKTLIEDPALMLA